MVATQRKVSDAAIARIIELGPSHSNRQIAAILAEEGENVSPSTVGRILNEERVERARVSREIVNEHIQRTVSTDLEILEEMRDQLNNWRQGLDDDGKPLVPKPRMTQRLPVMDRLNRVIDTRLKYSGADPADKLAEAVNSFAALMSKAAEE